MTSTYGVPSYKPKITSKPKRKTPVNIKRDQDIFAILRLMRNDTDLEVARKTWRLKNPAFHISVKTIRRMRTPVKYGGTRYPVKRTMDAIASAYGCEFVLTPKGN